MDTILNQTTLDTVMGEVREVVHLAAVVGVKRVLDEPVTTIASWTASGNWRWAYACTKEMDEVLAMAYHAGRGLPIVIGRLFNIVGPRQSGEWGSVRSTTSSTKRSQITGLEG